MSSAALPPTSLDGSTSRRGITGLLGETTADDDRNGDGEVTMTGYDLAATAEWDGGWWLVTIPELDTVGQARMLGEVNAVAREVAALFLNAPEEDVSVTVTVQMPHAAEVAQREALQRSARGWSRAVASTLGEE
jgi:hypothetical protein